MTTRQGLEPRQGGLRSESDPVPSEVGFDLLPRDVRAFLGHRIVECRDVLDFPERDEQFLVALHAHAGLPIFREFSFLGVATRTYVRYTVGVDLLDGSVPVDEAVAEMDLDVLRMALVDASASIAAAQARLARAMAIFRARSGESEGSGFTSFGQWASVDLGLSSRAASGLADAGDALVDRPAVPAAWESGTLSTTKARCVPGVATDASETDWCSLAAEASATQLSRIASAYRRNLRAESEADARREGREAEDRETACGVWWHTRDDGLRELLAVLTPDDAAVVQAALETEIETQWRATHR